LKPAIIALRPGNQIAISLAGVHVLTQLPDSSRHASYSGRSAWARSCTDHRFWFLRRIRNSLALSRQPEQLGAQAKMILILTLLYRQGMSFFAGAPDLPGR